MDVLKFKTLADKSVDDLISYDKAIDIAIRYYDNLTNISMGSYQDNEFYEKQYKDSREKIELYTNLRKHVLSEIEKRLNDIIK